MFFEGKDNGSMEKIQDAIAETLTGDAYDCEGCEEAYFFE